MRIRDLFIKYSSKIDLLDFELIVAHTINKSHEFVLAYPEYKISKFKIENLKLKISHRMRGEPLAYILGHKDFYGLDFKVNENTLIPRPETEILAELALQELATNNLQPITIIDIGTGSGNIIISLAKNSKSCRLSVVGCKLFGVDISDEALKIAKYNAKKHKVVKKIKFLKGNFLNPIIKNTKYQIPDAKYVILANLPYLSEKIYGSASREVKREPKSALLSAEEGLSHYKKLFAQIKKLSVVGCKLLVLIEISPEQKNRITKLIKTLFSGAKIRFFKDLAGKWRICKITL